MTTSTEKGPSSGTEWQVYPSVSLLSNATKLYQSPKTGLRGIAIATGEPLCSLHVVISTESKTNEYSHKDDGLPHTLEHAIFLGSQKYPYKGILDKLANRSLADGTNAWTATDHTAYTLTTAGEEGALNLLPIYADHILFPTLSSQSFMTEVHHITKEGNDKGVVYCEMQGRENTDGSLVDRALMDLLYPHNCGYSSETGGKLKNLRQLDNSQVQRYHEENYTPDNMMFVLSGNIEMDKFLKALDQVEQNILSKGEKSASKNKIVTRPWMGPVPPMDLTVVGACPPPPAQALDDNSSEYSAPHEIEFPSEDESRGTISIGWRGPLYKEKQDWVSLLLLWEYLTDSAASPLQKAFVECEEPLCAGVSPAHEIFTEGYHQLWFTEVEVEKMNQIIPKLFATLQKAKSDLDMDRMETAIRRYRRRLLEYSERRPTNALVDGIIRNFLYGPRGSDAASPELEMEEMKQDADNLEMIEATLTHTKEEWLALMDKYILGRPYGVVSGKPSAALATKMADEEKAREEQQAKDLGEEKLQELGDLLAKAIEFNEREIPEETLVSVPIPSLEKVKPVPCLTIRGVSEGIDVATNSGKGMPKEEVDTVLSKLREDAKQAGSEKTDPYHIDWNHIESAFLTVRVGFNTQDLSTRQRLFLPLLLELAHKLPATLEDGSTLTKDEFVSSLEKDTVSYSAGLGLANSRMPQMINFRVQIENPKGQGLEPAMKWTRRVLYLTKLTAEDVKIAVQRLLSEIPPQIRHGPTVSSSVLAELNYDPDVSNTVGATPLRQRPFLTELLQTMEKDKEHAEKVVQELEQVRKELVQPQNSQVFVAGNLLDIAKPMEIVADYLLPPGAELGSAPIGKKAENIASATVRRQPSSQDNETNPTGRAVICPLSAIESSFLSVTCPGVGSYDPAHASLLVAIEYLTALEGDFWVKLRGAGLTYGSSIRNSTESKLLKFGLFKCTDVAGAFAASSQILVDYASGKLEISNVGLESAKSSLAYGIISGTSTRLSAAVNAFVDQYDNNKQVDYDQWLLSKIGEVSKEDVMHALITYLVPIFDTKSNLAVACPTNKAEPISKYFKERGWGANVEVVPEDKLCTAFTNNSATTDKEDTPGKDLPDEKVAGVSMFMPGAFAAQFKCACPRCGRD